MLSRLLTLPALALVPIARSRATARSRIIVIGAGFGGATCARYLHLLSPASEVVLIDRRPSFYTGPFSNLAICGVRAAASIRRSVVRIAAADGVRLLEDEVVDCDPVSRRVLTARNGPLTADFVVVAPGIDLRWDLIEGLDAHSSALMPHAWLGDAQVTGLRERLARVRDGATIVVAAPPNPYRCPPGPYERAGLIADLMKRTGRSRVKILLVDAKDDFSQRALFQFEWDLLYPGVIEWIPRAQNGTVVRVDARAGQVWLQGQAQAIRADVATVIPAQRAASVAAKCDLADESGWCPVKPDNFESRRHAGFHVLGDAASAAPMPKSGFAASSQAKLCATAIAAALAGRPAPQPRLLNTCFSFVARDRAISVSALYSADNGRLATISEGTSPLRADPALRAREAREALGWYESITADSFGRP